MGSTMLLSLDFSALLLKAALTSATVLRAGL